MNSKEHMKMGIGFVTGRKNFKKLANTYVGNWDEHKLVKDKNTSLNLFVAYDLSYTGTKVSDYKKIDVDIYDTIESINFIDKNAVADEIRYLVGEGVINQKEARLVFGDGYGKKRNAVIYFAVKQKMDYLIFLDDDEYPVAPIRTEGNNVTWRGQNVVASHLKYIPKADITHGHHCGYISPIPYIGFNDTLTEEDFRLFIETISNDIISWDSIKRKMADGGITFADGELIDCSRVVEEIDGAKFISGSNLCFNLNNVEKIAPFYNPPGARGEDTFLSTCFHNLKVLKVPVYTFHDGFLKYSHLLDGVLPRHLKPVTIDAPHVASRFLKASVGWVRYKPLLLYITRTNNFKAEIEKMRENLPEVLPKLCKFFNTQEFSRIYDEFEHGYKNVEKHFDAFEEAKRVWKKIMTFVKCQ